MRALRIGFFTDSYFPRKDGTSYTIQLWKRKLEENGHEVFLYYPESSHEPGSNERELRAVPNPFHQGHHWPLPDLSRVEKDLDVVHCHSPWLIGYKGLRYSRKHGVPSVFTYHTPIQDHLYGFLKSKRLVDLMIPGVDWLDRRWLSSFDVVTCSTDAFPHEMDYEKIPVGVDDDLFRETDESFIDDLGLPEPVLGYSGRLAKDRRVEEILKLAERTDGSLIVVGEGREKERLESIAPGNVVFRDFLDRDTLPEFYTGIDVYVKAALSDTFSLTTMEANLCGTPVLVPDAPPFDETISERRGRRYEPGDIDDMEKKLEEVLRTEFDCRAEAMDYSVKKTVKRLEELYRGLDADG